MFSKACAYGIRALTVIAKAGKENRKIGIKKICAEADTPESFTAKILQNLVKQSIVSSQKGPTGGFYISKNLNEISLYDIVAAIDGTDVFTQCGLGLKECSSLEPCPFHFQFKVVRDELNKMCINNTLQDLVDGLYKDLLQQ